MVESFLGIAWENVAIGLLGGFIVSGVFYVRKQVSNWRLQRRFPVAGAFITRFEDQVGGERVTATAPATLEQHGRHITGTTIQDGRCWVIDGELSKSGYVHGVYEAQDPHDHGVGNFFLRVRPDRSMDGLWSGYDSTNEQIASGRYLFMPVASDVIIRPYRESDRVALLRIADLELGDGYLDGRSVSDFHASDSSFVKVAERNGVVVGFSLCMIQDQSTAAAAIRAAMPRHLQLAATLGVIKTVAVLSNLHGHGIGSRLIEESISELLSAGAEALYSVAWKNGSRVNIAGNLERLGFSKFAEVADFWRDDSLAQNFRCPACGEPPCHCSAIMFSSVGPNPARIP